jgi:hypothetical protein
MRPLPHAARAPLRATAAFWFRSRLSLYTCPPTSAQAGRGSLVDSSIKDSRVRPHRQSR